MSSYTVIAAIAWAVILGLGGGLLTTIGPWYHNLRKPTFQPPDWLFGPAWTVILGLAAWAFVIAWNSTAGYDARMSIMIAYGVNFVFHFAWSPLFFMARRPDWALIEVVPLWISVVVMMLVNFSLSPTAGWMIVPYVIWVAFAAVINYSVVQLNRPFGGKSVTGDQPAE